ncbi:MAG: oligosaccharide flippase family protein [Desulfotomaculaceae bacterium]
MSEVDRAEQVKKTSIMIARHGGIVIIGSIISSVVRFLTQVILGRALGAEKYGLFALGFSLFSMAGQVSQLGLTEGIIKYGAVYKTENDQSRLKGLLQQAVIFVAAAAVVVAIMIYYSAPYLAMDFFNKSELVPVIKYFALSVPFFALGMISAASARAVQSITDYTLIQYVWHPVIFIVFVGATFLVGPNISNAIGAFVLAWLLVFIFSAVSMLKTSPVFRPGIRPVYETRHLFRFVIPVFLAKWLPLLINNIDKVILGKLVLTGDVGIYNAGSKVAVQILIFMQALNLIFAPIVAAHFHDHKLEELNALFKTVTYWTVALTLPVVLWMTLNAELIMGLFGSEFTTGKNILILCCLAQFISVCTGPLEYLLIMGRQDLHLINNLVLAFINVACNIILINKYGVFGAVLTLGISMFLYNFVRLVEVYILYRLFPYNGKFIKVFVIAVVVTALALLINKFLSDGFLSAAISFVILFGGFYWLLNLWGLDEEDRAVVLLVKRKVGGIFMRDTSS